MDLSIFVVGYAKSKETNGKLTKHLFKEKDEFT